MTTLTLKMLSQHLATIPHRERYRSLTAWLIRYLRQSQMDISSHLQDIITHGCVSGLCCETGHLHHFRPAHLEEPNHAEREMANLTYLATSLFRI